MLRNYLRIALRGFKRQPGYALLNIVGLSIGVAATLFILLYITNEMAFDKFHEKHERVFRVSSDITEPDDAFRWANTQVPLGAQLKNDFPEVEEFVRLMSNGRTPFQYNDRQYFEEDIFFADSTFADVFTFDFIVGDPGSALDEPNAIVLSEEVATRIFGDNDPLGEVIKTQEDQEYKITGVYRNFPPQSHIIPKALISASSVDFFMNPNAGAWGSFGIYTYVLLREGTDPAQFESKLSEIIDNYVAVIFDQFDISIKYELIGLADIHLQSDFEGEPEPLGEMGFIYIFGAVALFMLLIACINYMNLSTARATKRAMEVGIRKVLGSERAQLVGQFLSESVIFSLLAMVLSFLVVLITLPLFNSAFDLSLDRSLLLSPQILIGALLILLITGILGGSYPAFYLSSFRPIKVLKGKLAKGAGNPNLRKVLVTVQFAITLFMIIGTGIIYDQMNYLRTKELGFDKEHILHLSLESRADREKYDVLRDELLQYSEVSSVASASTSPGNGFNKQVMSVENDEGVMNEYGVDNYYVDYHFFPTLNIPFVEGRNFSLEFGTDTAFAAIVNESMVDRMGWADPIGKRIQFQGNDTLPMARVIGVVRDFHQQALYEPIAPLVFRPFTQGLSQVHVKLNPQDANSLNGVITHVERVWNEVFPDTPFEYEFVDAQFMDLYQADQVRAKIFTLFSLMMIFIACLGLLGLASFTAEQRTKEIGVRKILGAKTSNIVVLLTRNFVLLVALACIPAFIAAWLLMTRWLDSFSYHTEMNYALYALAFFMVVLITLLTTGYHAMRAAVSNPVMALRHE